MKKPSCHRFGYSQHSVLPKQKAACLDTMKRVLFMVVDDARRAVHRVAETIPAAEMRNFARFPHAAGASQNIRVSSALTANEGHQVVVTLKTPPSVH
jgi:hypothetical protein